MIGILFEVWVWRYCAVLSLLAEHQRENPRKNDPWILTPHPKETAKLLGCLTAEIQKDRKRRSSRLVNSLAVFVYSTLVADLSGVRVWIVATRAWEMFVWNYRFFDVA